MQPPIKKEAQLFKQRGIFRSTGLKIVTLADIYLPTSHHAPVNLLLTVLLHIFLLYAYKYPSKFIPSSNRYYIIHRMVVS